MPIVMARCSIVLLGAMMRTASATALTGAGSTFVYPLLAKWASAYARVTDVRVNYQSIGSGGGLKQIESGTVDFAATDVPLPRAEALARGLAQFPVIAGAIVPVVHLTGVDDQTLTLSGPTLAAIYRGDIKRWTDARVRALNPGLTMPDRAITVVHRADGSGTTHVFSAYLSAVDQAWAHGPGTATAITWPTGVGAKGNEGVAAFVKLTEGAIGYVDNAVVVRARLTGARLIGRNGRAVAADQAAVRAALGGVSPSDGDDHPSLVDAPAPGAWPITGVTYALMRRADVNVTTTRATLDFFRWGFDHGAALATELHYVSLPAAWRTRVIDEWATWAGR